MISCIEIVILAAFCGTRSALDHEVVTEFTTAKPSSICDICNCTNGSLDCNDVGLTEPFSPDEWDDLKSYNIQNISITGNTIKLLNQIPELSLEVLNVSKNGINEVEEGCFRNLPNLAVLDLSGNQIVTLHRTLWGLIQLNSTFRGFPNMRHLSVAANEIHTLAKDTFSFMNDLTYLDLSWNPLGIIDQVVMGALSDLRNLKELRLSGCDLESLPEGLLRRHRRLERLDISFNKFQNIPSALGESANLVALNFDGNFITSIDEMTPLAKLKKLQYLSICCNTKLQTIGPGALGLESLSTLKVCDNPKLSYIDEDFLTWHDENDNEKRPVLKEFHLNNNNLTMISSHYLFRWDQLNVMAFSDNPYICDCRNQWLVDVLTPLVLDKDVNMTDMICVKPPDLRGMTFTKLYQTSKTLTCKMKENLTQLPTAPIILGVLIGMFTTIPIVLAGFMLWRKGYFARCRKQMTSVQDSDEENNAF